MSCYRCAAAFGFLSRSHGCKKCGHLFCSKCCHEHVQLPELGPGKHRVCFNCLEQRKKAQADVTGGLRAAGVPSSVTAMAGLVENPNPMVTSTAHGSPRSSPQPGRAGLSQPDPFSHLPPSQRKAAQNRAALAQRSAQPPEDVKLEERLRDLQSSPRQGRKEVGASDSSYAGSPSPRRSPQPPRQPSAFAHLPPSQRVAAGKPCRTGGACRPVHRGSSTSAAVA